MSDDIPNIPGGPHLRTKWSDRTATSAFRKIVELSE